MLLPTLLTVAYENANCMASCLSADDQDQLILPVRKAYLIGRDRRPWIGVALSRRYRRLNPSCSITAMMLAITSDRESVAKQIWKVGPKTAVATTVGTTAIANPYVHCTSVEVWASGSRDKRRDRAVLCTICKRGMLHTSSVNAAAANRASLGVTVTCKTGSTTDARISARTKRRLSRRIEIGLAAAKI